MTTQITRAYMEEKYEWAQQAYQEIQLEAQDFFGATAPTDVKKLQRSFWAFLEAYQQIRAHHGKWAEKNTGKKQQNALLDEWKATFLTEQQSTLWDMARDIRTLNAHSEPVYADITVQEVSRVTHTGRTRITHNGQARNAVVRYIAVQFNNTEYNLLQLVSTTLLGLRQFIDTFDYAST
jgi:hypothetical protein